jgi:hypothetical protein
MTNLRQHLKSLILPQIERLYNFTKEKLNYTHMEHNNQPSKQLYVLNNIYREQKIKDYSRNLIRNNWAKDYR